MAPADGSAGFTSVGIGHNGGPPLDPGAGWRLFCWKKAQMLTHQLPTNAEELHFKRRQQIATSIWLRFY